MPCSSNTNNTAEYTALLLVQGLSPTMASRTCGSRVTARLSSSRQANGHADRLATAALDRCATKLECGVHTDGTGCTSTSMLDPIPAATPPPAPPLVSAGNDVPPSPAEDDDMGDIDDGEVYAAMNVGPDAVPQRRSRLRLRALGDNAQEAASKVVERLAATLAAKATDASDWEEAEGYITALPNALYDKLQPYSQDRHHAPPRAPRSQQELTAHQHAGVGGAGQSDRVQSARAAGLRSRRRRGRPGGVKRQRRTRPPRVTRHHREHRLDEALDAMHDVQRIEPGNRKAVAKARRRVGRINSSLAQQRLRHLFDTDEKVCVKRILTAAKSQVTARTNAGSAQPSGSTVLPSEAPDDGGTCPIPGARLHELFTAVSGTVHAFEPLAPVGAPFRAALSRLSVASSDMGLLQDAPCADEIEYQVQRARGSSSPGLDGVGCDIYKMFLPHLLTALHAAFACCWKFKRVP
ncbi:unnamed protein product [Peronospora destructor]|uniref:Reverse transcriptase domain-containing protein n=1 Tax=Peronospora destructor TaxID=86335 RepID=A0AAV0UC66_9STRA|nr:unnamed protein product [Peronospora destructor]